MEKFLKISGVAAPMPAANIDTDIIMPKRFLKEIDKSGLVNGLFRDIRMDQDNQPLEDFILNQTPWQNARFLVVGPNFGCGSSREHAVWGLQQRGLRALIGSSFAGIFFDNCANNGVLAVCLPTATIQEILQTVSDPSTNEITVDLVNQTIFIAQKRYPFEIEASRKERLMAGLDAVDRTLKEAQRIKDFEDAYYQQFPWLA